MAVFYILPCNFPAWAGEDANTWEQLTAQAVLEMKASHNDQAKRLCTQAMEIVSPAAAGDTRLAKTQILMGEIHRWGKRFDLAEQSYKDAIVSCEKAVGPNNPDMAIPLDSLANFYYFTQARYDLVAPLYERILNIVENEPNRDEGEVARRARNLAEVYILQKQYAKAEPVYKQALKSAEKVNDDVPNYLLGLAGFYSQWGKCEQAEAPAKRALEIREKAARPGSGTDAQLDLAVALDGLAKVYLACGKFEQAEALYSQSLAIIEETQGRDNPDTASRLVGLGQALRGQKKYEQAEIQYMRAIFVTEKNLGENAPEAAEMLEKYAVLLNDMNKPDEAKQKLKRAETIRKNAAAE